jgi:hypothetical protein
MWVRLQEAPPPEINERALSHDIFQRLLCGLFHRNGHAFCSRFRQASDSPRWTFAHQLGGGSSCRIRSSGLYCRVFSNSCCHCSLHNQGFERPICCRVRAVRGSRQLVGSADYSTMAWDGIMALHSRRSGCGQHLLVRLCAAALRIRSPPPENRLRSSPGQSRHFGRRPALLNFPRERTS